MSHECPAHDCGVISTKGVLMCRKHWRMVPRPVQREVTAAWGAYLRVHRKGQGRMEAWRDYGVARKAAVDFVNGRLAKA